MGEENMSTYMQQSLQLAEKGRFSVQPNPMVGCIIERNDQIVGRGWHKAPGLPHAEIEALNDAGAKARGANVYVNLEPCSHHGRTPPCVDALIKAQPKSVHIAMPDPNPLVNGNGIKKLRVAGIEVYIGEEEQKATQLNEIFSHYITRKTPFVIAKWAMSLDGKTATDNGQSKWISGEESREYVQQIRQNVRAILVGAKTVINDNPQLTVRLDSRLRGNDEIKCGNDTPLRIILDSSGNVPADARVFDTDSALVATTQKSNIIWREKLSEKNIKIIICPEDKNGKVDLIYLLNELGKREISSLLVEGGREVLNSFFAAQLVNKVYTFIAPKLIGNITDMKNVSDLICEQYQIFGNDILITAKPEWRT
jgi:diaminohydroxyphosphoribosylaminopyrimidine deaminase/5-amino-6-(5-phosphoribosylamino)uracil reductase